MTLNWKLDAFRRLFGLKKSKRPATKKLQIENLEERIECATKVWNGSLAGVGSDGNIATPAYGVNGDPTFSSFMASVENSSGFGTLGDNWDPTLGQSTLPQNGDTLVFPLLAAAPLLTPTSGIFGDLTRIDLTPTSPGTPPGPIQVNLINDLAPDSEGNLPGYLRNLATGANYVDPLVYVDQIFFNGSGYYLYSRDNPQFGPELIGVSPPNYFVGGETVTAEFFYPGATNDQQTPFYNPNTFQIGSTVYVDPTTYNPLNNISYTPAVALNIQTQLVADYAGSSLVQPTDTSAGNANWIYSPINVGNPNAPEGSSFVFDVVQEGSWLILDSDIAEASSGNRSGGYVLLNDVNNNKIVKQGLGILVFESNNQYTGLTSVEEGLLIVSDNNGLGDALTNSNVEVASGSLMLSTDQYGTNDSNNLANVTITNRNLILNGGDGFIPLTVGTGAIPLYIPFGQFTGRDARLSLLSTPHQWVGTVTLNSNPTEVTTSLSIADPYGITAPIDPANPNSGIPANPNGDPSVGQEFGSITEINGVISGIAGLRKWGAGTVELTQANTFNGDVVVFDGFLNAQNNLALGVPTDGAKDIIIRELPANLLAANQQLAGALSLGDEVNGGQNLVFGTQYNLVIQDGNLNTNSNNGPDQNPSGPLGAGTRVEGLGAFQVVSPSNNPNAAEWQGQVTVETNASIGGTPNSTLLISGNINANSGITVEKRGSMTVGISSDNSATFLGNWLVSNGNLQLQNNDALGAAGSVNVTQLSPALPALSGGGSIQMVGNGLDIVNDVTIQGTGYNGFGALQSIGTNTWSGVISVANTSSLGAGAGSEMIISGNIVQTPTTPVNAQVIKIGAGNVVFTTPLSFNLPIAVQEGTLRVQDQGDLGSGQNGLVTVSTSVPTSPATLALSGGINISNRTLSLDGLGVAGAGALRSFTGDNEWGGTINLAGTMQLAYVGVDTDTLELSGRIDGGSSTLHKTGAGTLIISGDGNSQGSTVVGAGLVYQLGSDNVPVFVNTSGTLSGDGRTGVLQMTPGQNGTVTPGTQNSSVAILNTGGINARSSVGVFQFDLNSQSTKGQQPQAGQAYDQLNVRGAINLSGSPVLSLNLNFQPTVRGTTYTIINNDGSDSVVGTFNGQAEGSYITANNITYQVSYRGGDGNDVTLTCVGVLTNNLLTSSDVDNLTKYGQSVTYTSTLTAPTGVVNRGTVQFFDQGIAIGQPMAVTNGSASITLTTLSVNGSPHVITSTFSGGTSIFSLSDSNILAHTVNKADSSVAVSSPTPVYGTNLPLTITATITPEFSGGSATGQVLFRINGNIQPLQVIDVNSTNPTTGARTSTLVTSLNPAGFYSIDALYLGDSNVNGSSFSPIFSEQILTTAVTTLGLSSSRNPADRLDLIDFTATVSSGSGTPVGLVQFYDNGALLGAALPLSGGIATLQTSSLTGGRHVITAQYLGAPDNSFTQYFGPSSASISQAIQATSNLIVTGTNVGGGPMVNVFDRQTGTVSSFFAFAPEFKGGVRVATGDVNGDSIPDVVAAAGPGGGPQVNVYDGTNYQLIRSFYAYDPSFPDGIYVAVGDVNGDGFSDIITGAGAGGGPHVQVFSGLNYSNIGSFFAYASTFTGGVSVAGGDVNGDGYVDIVIGAGAGGGPHVRAVSGSQLTQSGTIVDLANFFAFDPGVNRGVFVGAGDYNGDIVSDIVVAAGPGGGPHVKVFTGNGTGLIDNFFAYDINFAGGLTVAMADIENDGIAEIVTGPYTSGGPQVKVFKYLSGEIDTFWAYDPAFNGGIFVG